MKMSTLKLLVPIVAITVQSNSASTIIPPFLHDLRIPMAAIGSLISLGPILALTSRLPVGMAYQRNRAIAYVDCRLGYGDHQLFL